MYERSVILIGMPGSGKTTAGQALSKTLGLPLVDTDAVLSQQLGMTVQEIFSTKGAGAFRILERECMRFLLGRNRPMVLSTGGGLPCYFNNMTTLLGSGQVFWLNPKVETLTDRLWQQQIETPGLRPLIAQMQDYATLKDWVLNTLAARQWQYRQAHNSATTVSEILSILNRD